jgi:hypothetical protein
MDNYKTGGHHNCCYTDNCDVVSSQHIRQKLLVNLILDRIKLKENSSSPQIKQYDWCSKTVTEHLHSHWCITVDEDVDSKENNCISTTCCLPFKIIFYLPCHLGTCFNSLLNNWYNTDKNYLL